MIDKNSRYLFIGFAVLIFIVIVFTYFRFIVKKDYPVFLPTPETSEEVVQESV